MRLRVRGDADALRSSISFSTSGMIHGTVLALVVFGRTGAPPERAKSLYDEAIRGREKQIVWYRIPDKLPEVAPGGSRPTERRPLRATRKSEQRIVSGARDDGRPPQLVWSPAPEVPAPQTTPLPNVLAVEMKPLVKAFTPPAPKTVVAPAPVLPEAEAVALRGAAPMGAALSPLKKTFTPPPVKVAAGGTAVLPDADAVSLRGAAPAGPNLAPLRKTFTPPAAPAPRAATTNGAEPPEVTQLAIIGLNPSKAPDLPAPPAPREAGFSAGPRPEPNGAASDGNSSGAVVPGVTVRDGVSRQSLLAAIRPLRMPLPAGPPPDSPLPPTRVTSAPDPSLDGRVVYTVAIQMPNVTSYSGSWLVWFAERERSAVGEMRAPSPIRKVDPKYIASAVADGVQGVVRLGAVIRKDGRIEAVKLLRHLDDRLDTSAMESLAKWQFEPALRNGAPVDVDAVFEIPFRLAPKPSR